MYATHFRVTWFNWWLNDFLQRGEGIVVAASGLRLSICQLSGSTCPSGPPAPQSWAVSHKAASSKDTWHLLQPSTHSTPAQGLLGISAFLKRKSCSWNILLCRGGGSGLSVNTVLSRWVERPRPSRAAVRGSRRIRLPTESDVSLSELRAPNWAVLISGACFSF